MNHHSMTEFLSCENKYDANECIEVAKNYKVTKKWLFKQKQVNNK